ncbi:hypothetical protein AVEN_222957-1 [Araneus ventricosus]|uniref:Uncharacterized protein n=1 Tax=Araneus ventricosus TaxID=182803 RepID=A0A4Y2UET7_ARAVE|nr:hypothetical protein AVEN_222957-1 [Araneus ventricosus]
MHVSVSLLPRFLSTGISFKDPVQAGITAGSNGKSRDSNKILLTCDDLTSRDTSMPTEGGKSLSSPHSLKVCIFLYPSDFRLVATSDWIDKTRFKFCPSRNHTGSR